MLSLSLSQTHTHTHTCTYLLHAEGQIHALLLLGRVRRQQTSRLHTDRISTSRRSLAGAKRFQQILVELNARRKILEREVLIRRVGTTIRQGQP